MYDAYSCCVVFWLLARSGESFHAYKIYTLDRFQFHGLLKNIPTFRDVCCLVFDPVGGGHVLG